MKIVIIHRNVDLDAIVAAWFTMRFENVFAVVTEGSEEYENLKSLNVSQNFDVEYIVLDMPLPKDIDKSKVIMHVDHHDGSAPSTVAKLKEIYADRWEPWMDYLLEVANAADTGRIIRIKDKALKLFHITGIINALRTAGRSDEAIISMVFSILAAYETLLRRIAEAEEKAKDVPVHRIEDYEVAVVEGDRVPTATLFERGCDFIIFKDGNNLGVMRNAAISEPSLVNLKPFIEEKLREKGRSEEINEWFFHPAGFIAARGTRKHPAKTPSVLDEKDLLRGLEKVL